MSGQDDGGLIRALDNAKNPQQDIPQWLLANMEMERRKRKQPNHTPRTTKDEPSQEWLNALRYSYSTPRIYSQKDRAEIKNKIHTYFKQLANSRKEVYEAKAVFEVEDERWKKQQKTYDEDDERWRDLQKKYDRNSEHSDVDKSQLKDALKWRDFNKSQLEYARKWREQAQNKVLGKQYSESLKEFPKQLASIKQTIGEDKELLDFYDLKYNEFQTVDSDLRKGNNKEFERIYGVEKKEVDEMPRMDLPNLYPVTWRNSSMQLRDRSKVNARNLHTSGRLSRKDVENIEKKISLMDDAEQVLSNKEFIFHDLINRRQNGEDVTDMDRTARYKAKDFVTGREHFMDFLPSEALYFFRKFASELEALRRERAILQETLRRNIRMMKMDNDV